MSESLQNAQDTTAEVVETEDAQENKTINQEDTTKVEEPKVETEPKEEVFSKEELEAAKLAADKAQKRANQLEHELKEALSSTESNSETVEQLKARLEAIEAEREADATAEATAEQEKIMTQKAKEVFEKGLSKYPEQVQKIAKATYGDDPWSAFGQVDTWFDAESNLVAKLNAIEDNLDTTNVRVDNNNPIEPKDKPKDIQFEGDGVPTDDVVELLSKRAAEDFKKEGINYPFDR
jgi:hypothetical protein